MSISKEVEEKILKVYSDKDAKLIQKLLVELSNSDFEYFLSQNLAGKDNTVIVRLLLLIQKITNTSLEAYILDTIKFSNKFYETLSRTDFLTQLMNRRAFDEDLVTQIAAFDRHGKNFTLAIIDLNKFKEVNDTKGHKAGDLCLQDFANFLNNSTRKIDKVYRLAGDEFAVIFYSKDLEDTAKILKRLTKISPQNFTFGLASYQESLSAEELFKEADKELYLNKA